MQAGRFRRRASRDTYTSCMSSLASSLRAMLSTSKFVPDKFVESRRCRHPRQLLLGFVSWVALTPASLHPCIPASLQSCIVLTSPVHGLVSIRTFVPKEISSGHTRCTLAFGTIYVIKAFRSLRFEGFFGSKLAFTPVNWMLFESS